MKYVVIADDLTGSNATCSLLKKIGLSTASIFKLEKDKNYKNDVVSYSTDSRAISKKDAYNRVFQTTQILKNNSVLLYNKRIDSTLRGNIGSEIEGMLDALNEDRVAILVPSYPDSGRIVVNKTMLVNGILLEHSDAGRDTKTPVISSNVEEIIKNQTKLNTAYFTLKDISKSETELTKNIIEKSKDNKILIFDSVTNEDIIKISKAVLKSNLKIITVDPGPFTMYYSSEMKKITKTDKKILMVIGSATDTTKQQIEHILQHEDIFLVKMKPSLFFDKKTRLEEIKRVCELIYKGINNYELIMLTTTPIGDDKRLDLQKISNDLNISIDEVSKIIAQTLTEAASDVLLTSNSFEGVYSSGGDITLALLEKLEAIGVEIRDEVIPLAAYGRIIEGKIGNLKLVSKGGMVGNKETIKLCLHKIKNDI